MLEQNKGIPLVHPGYAPALLNKLQENFKRGKTETGSLDMKLLMNQAQKLSDQLLAVCEGEIQGKPSGVSLGKDLGFNHRSTPCPLVVPLESTLAASLPIIPDTMKTHKAFARDTITISCKFTLFLLKSSLTSTSDFR